MSIKGYRKLTEDEIEWINKIKESEISLGALWKKTSERTSCDPRWLAIAKTHFEEGFSALVRSIAQPEDRF